MINRAVMLVAVLFAVSAPSYGETIELAHDEPFTGEKIFCVEVSGPVGKEGYLLTYTLSLADKGIPIKYLFDGRLMKDFTADYEFKARHKVPSAGKYAFAFATTARTTISKFEVSGDPADTGVTLSRCK